MKRIPFFFGVLVFESVADIFAKQFELSKSRWIYLVALVAYAVGNSLWLMSMKFGIGLGKGTLLFGIFSTIITLFIAFRYYKEPLTTTNFIGVVVCMVGLVLLEWGGVS